MRKIRIGIDVGGTYTDAVAIDSENYEILSHIKIPTTHDSEEGVVKGVVEALFSIMEKGKIKAEEVSFIAHGTTQATNALLEGDVSHVGIIGMGSGLELMKVKSDLNFGKIQLTDGKFLNIQSEFLDTSKGVDEDRAKELINKLLRNGSKVIVACEAYSVDNPQNEKTIQRLSNELGVYSSTSHEISKLYGLSLRSRTAAINGSILPKMINTANMTQNAVDNANIKTPLMIMRCDGGVMNIEEIKKRPILTILSGPAAGVAGALMYERVSDGIFLEVGGTSTDISAIKNGKVMINYAEIGGHKTYVSSLDVRTVGIGGGSMVRISGDKLADVGPRSAHIALCGYCTYAPLEVIKGGELKFISPLESDPDEYAIIVGTDKKKYAITLSCAANYLDYIDSEDYAHGNKDSAEAALQLLADYLASTPEKVARKIIEIATNKNAKVVKELIKEYELSSEITVLTGGGGGASSVLWPLSEKLNIEGQLSKNSPIISTIGAALAMIRDVVERSIVDPTEEDLFKIRSEAEYMAIASGANPETVEVNIEIDSNLNRVRAIAIGTTELVRKDLGVEKLDEKDIKEIAMKALNAEDEFNISLESKTDFFYIFKRDVNCKGIMKLFKNDKSKIAVLDQKGVVRLNLENGHIGIYTGKMLKDNSLEVLKDYAVYDESGERTPDVFLLIRGKIIDLKGIPNIKQLASLVELESKTVDEDESIIVLIKK